MSLTDAAVEKVLSELLLSFKSKQKPDARWLQETQRNS